MNAQTLPCDMNSQIYPSDTVKFSIPALMGNAVAGTGGVNTGERGLAGVSVDTLRKCLQPVMEGLKQVDAEALLNLQRTGTDVPADKNHSADQQMPEEARLRDGINVRPIHREVQPRCDEDTVRYIHLSEIPGQYSMGVFVFPPHSKIPLHDHPGMCVLSRVLYGELDRLSLDLVREYEDDPVDSDKPHGESKVQARSRRPHMRIPPGFPPGTKRAFKHKVDRLSAPGCTVLYPYEGNLHEFVAGPNGAAVLDVLLPPYDVEQGRDCTFYEIHEIEFSQRSSAFFKECEHARDEQQKNCPMSTQHEPCWIVPTGQPEDFHCISGEYVDIGGRGEEDS